MTIRLEHDTVAAALADVRRAAGDLAEMRERAVGKVATLLDGGWSGAAASSFADGWADWTAAADDVTAGLHHLADALALAQHRLELQDAEVRGAVDRLVARLG